MYERRTIPEIAETLRNAKERKKCCSLLVGAGCSVKAGIPTAAGFVQEIRKRYPEAYKRADPKTYPKCMNALTLGERRDLVAEYVDKAKINWGHVCIGQLMKHGYVDRVLTTNFDSLVVRACALLGEFPAVYDFAISQLFKKADIPGKAIFHLHGQRTGFVLMNTAEEVERHSKYMGPVFEDAGSGRVWIVVGYSGENDSVFNHLAGVEHFDNGLYWVGYGDNEPGAHVREQLLSGGKDAFHCSEKGLDADSFFIRLTQELKLFPPSFLSQPFSHLKGTIGTLTAFELPGQTSEQDVTRVPLEWIGQAIEQFEGIPASPASGANETLAVPEEQDVAAVLPTALQRLMAGDYEGLLALVGEKRSSGLDYTVSWAYVMQGNALSDQARGKTGDEADRLFTRRGKISGRAGHQAA